jgi:hypothetical protein
MSGRQVIFWGIFAGCFSFSSISLFGQLVVHDSYIPIVTTAEFENRVDSYVPLVAAAKLPLDHPRQNHKELERCANQWISAWDSGKIRTIFSSYSGDNVEEGPRAEIIQTCYRLAHSLNTINVANRERVTPEETVKNSIVVLRLINIVRNFSVDSACNGSLIKKRPLTLIAKYLPQCGKSQVKLAAAVLLEEDRSNLLISQLKHHEKSLSTQYAVRYGTSKSTAVEENYEIYTKFSLTASNNFNSPTDRVLLSQVRACGFVQN